MATNTFNNGSANLLWNDAGNWSLSHVPLAGEDVALATFAVVMDCVRIPATTGSLGTITVTSGTLNIAVDNALFHDALAGGDGNFNCTVISANLVTVHNGMVVLTGTLSDHYFVLNCTSITGGASGGHYAIAVQSDANITINCTSITGGANQASYAVISNTAALKLIINVGTITGGAGANAGPQSAGVYSQLSTWTLGANCNLIHSNSAAPIGGYMPTWAPGAANYIQMSGLNFAQQLHPGEYLEGVTNGTADGAGHGGAGTYHEATEAEVQSGVQFGAASALTGTYAGGGGSKAIPSIGSIGGR